MAWFLRVMKRRVPAGPVDTFPKMLRFVWNTPRKTNVTMEKQQFEDVSPIENGDFPASHVSFFSGVYNYLDIDHKFFPPNVGKYIPYMEHTWMSQEVSKWLVSGL